MVLSTPAGPQGNLQLKMDSLGGFSGGFVGVGSRACRGLSPRGSSMFVSFLFSLVASRLQQLPLQNLSNAVEKTTGGPTVTETERRTGRREYSRYLIVGAVCTVHT